MARKSPAPTIDLPERFEHKAQDMLLGVKQGRAAHRVRNIKASGDPLEKRFRALLSDSLPSNHRVASGYFYGPASTCSPENDVLVFEDAEAFRLDPSPQEQHYIPYTSVSVMGQVKNSGRQIADGLRQAHDSLVAWDKMRHDLIETGGHPSGSMQDRPLSFLIIGDCSDGQAQRLKQVWTAAPKPTVNYILLLNRGEIVAGSLGEVAQFSGGQQIDFYSYRNAWQYHLCRPSPSHSTPYKVGVALMWFYFSLVSKLNLDRGNNLRYHSFCQQINLRYPLEPFQNLS